MSYRAWGESSPPNLPADLTTGNAENAESEKDAFIAR